MVKKLNYSETIEVPEKGFNFWAKSQEVPPFLKDRIERVLIPEFALKKRVHQLARKIVREAENSKEIFLIYILEGARVFMSDLEREIYRIGGLEVKSHSIKAITYAQEIKQEGEKERKVKILWKPEGLKAKDVIVVEDILDQGFTLTELVRILKDEEGVNSVRLCLLLAKRLKAPSEQAKQLREGLKVDYLGFSIPDRWVAGYGIDSGGDFRYLPYIVIVKEDYYLKR